MSTVCYFSHSHAHRCEFAAFNSLICFISGDTEAFITPETPCEEPQGEKIQAFVQDTLDAHEEFLQSQTTQGPDEQKPNNEHVEAEQLGEGSFSRH